jgi:hypothetical protein
MLRRRAAYVKKEQARKTRRSEAPFSLELNSTNQISSVAYLGFLKPGANTHSGFHLAEIINVNNRSRMCKYLLFGT